MRRSLLRTVKRSIPHGSNSKKLRPGIQFCRLLGEILEDRRLLSSGSPQLELFRVSPALFAENQGQWADESIRFMHSGDGANVAMTDAGPVFQVFRRELKEGAATESENGLPPEGPGSRFDPDQYVTETLTFSASFVGANAVVPVGLERSETQFNYFVGPQENWHSGVSTYRLVAYEGLYQGIDLLTWGQRDSLKYEFHVAPGADYRQIQVHYDGISGLSLAENGSLVVNVGNGWGSLVDDKPYVYQQFGGQKAEVAGRFRLLDNATYSFEITGPYDPTRELLIDPDLAWITYLGGWDWNFGRGIGVDSAGNATVTGWTFEDDFAGANNTYHGGNDAFVAKVSSEGTLVWATYLGGSDDDYGCGIAADSAGNALVMGCTYSDDLAGANNTYHGGYGDGFVAKVSGDGALVWATYLGGSDEDAPYYAATIAGIGVDCADNALVTGCTYSDDFAGANNTYHGEDHYDAFVAKVGSDGALVWATYLGGSDEDKGYGIGVDSADNALVTGYSESADFLGVNNTFHGASDAFVAKVSSDGALVWASYLGGSDWDEGYGISVDGADHALVTGETWSTDFPRANNAHHSGYYDVFVAKLSSVGALVWATYLGGSSFDGGHGIGVDSADNALVTGYTHSEDFTGANNTYHGAYDGFVARVSSDGALVWATYLGGSDDDRGNRIAVDSAGNTLVAGDTSSQDFAGANNANHGGWDAFVVKIPAPFEILAKGVAYKDWAPGSPVVFDGVDLGYTVAADGVFGDDSTGFYALGLLSDSYGPALVIRGTEDVLDWWDNSDPRGVGYGQFFANWPSVSTWLSDLPHAPDIIGHSLGGAIAQWIAAAFTARGGTIDQLVTFNSPGISDNSAKHPGLLTYARDFKPDKATGVTHYIVNGDVVSMAGEAFVAGEVRMASFSDLSMWMWDFVKHKHLLPLLTPSIGGRQQPSGLSWQSLSVTALGDSWFSHTDRDYRRWLIASQVGLQSLAIANPAINALVPVPAMLIRRGTTESGRQWIGRALREVVGLAKWTAQTASQFVLMLKERAHDLYEATRITVEDGFRLVVDLSDPRMLQFQGGLSVDVGHNVDIKLPSWLGGSFTAEHLMHLVAMDANGVMDRDHLAVDGQLAVLGDLLTLNGSAELHWRRGEWATSGEIDVLDGFITAGVTIRVGSRLDLVTQGAAAVAIPRAVRWIGGTQIAGGEFMLKFVNDGNMVNDFVAGWGSIGSLKVGLRAWFDGRWDILGAREINSLILPGARLMAASDEKARLAADMPLVGAAPYSESYSIAPGTGWVLFADEWDNPSLTAAVTLQTPSGQVLTEADIEADPSMAMVPELSNDRRKVVRINAPEAGTWVVTVTDTTGLGTVDIAAFVGNAPPTVNVVGLSGGIARRPVQVDVEAHDADSEAQIALFYDTDNQGFDGVMITDGLLESDGLTHYSWDTSGAAAGEYYVFAMILDGANPPVFDYWDSPVEITIDTAPPVVTLSVASPTSDTTPSVTVSASDGGSGMAEGAAVALDVDLNHDGDYLDAGESSYTLGTLSGGVATFDISPALAEEGTYTLRARVSDIAGNEGTSAVAAVVVDTTAPTVTLSGPSAPVTAGGPISYTVTYADADFNASTLGTGDVTLNHTGTANGTVSVSSGTGLTRTITISNITGDGSLGISVAAATAADTAGNLAPAAGPSGTFVVDNTAPTNPSLNARNVKIGGGTSYPFTVTYADNIAVKVSTLDSSGIVVTGPKGFSQSATFDHVDTNADGTPRTATYWITPPGGMWDRSDNGTYTATMQSDQVTDTAGNPLAAGLLGTFTLNAKPDKTPPKASLTAPNVTTVGDTSYAFTVTYTDNVEVRVSTLDSLDVRVTGPHGCRQLATFDHVDINTNGTPRTATYRITPPGGSWSAGNNGVYTVTMQSKQVKDTTGNAVASGKLGTFTVDTVAPTASLKAANVTKAGGKTCTFSVTYADNLAVNAATLDNSDILVTGPNGFSQAAAFVSVNNRKYGTPRKATYRFVPPGGAWNAADNGTYTISIQPNQVTDRCGNPVAAASLGTFTVGVPATAVARAASESAGSIRGPAPANQAALVAAAADAALSPQRSRRETAVLPSLFASIDDWLWEWPAAENRPQLKG